MLASSPRVAMSLIWCSGFCGDLLMNEPSPLFTMKLLFLFKGLRFSWGLQEGRKVNQEDRPFLFWSRVHMVNKRCAFSVFFVFLVFV